MTGLHCYQHLLLLLRELGSGPFCPFTVSLGFSEPLVKTHRNAMIRRAWKVQEETSLGSGFTTDLTHNPREVTDEPPLSSFVKEKLSALAASGGHRQKRMTLSP